MNFEELLNGYERLAYTNNYILGFVENGEVVFSIVKSEVLAKVCKLDKASRGAGNSLRFAPNKEQKAIIKEFGLVTITNKKVFDEMVETSIYNRGEVFEKLVTEHFGQVWEKDNIPFTEDGDLTVNGVAYQIKFEKATFISEKSLRRFENLVA